MFEHLSLINNYQTEVPQMNYTQNKKIMSITEIFSCRRSLNG